MCLMKSLDYSARGIFSSISHAGTRPDLFEGTKLIGDKRELKVRCIVADNVNRNYCVVESGIHGNQV